MREGQKLILHQTGHKGRVATFIEKCHTRFPIPTHYILVKLKNGSTLLIPECNAHPLCKYSHHPVREARWQDEIPQDYYCQQCAEAVNFKVFGRILQPVLRYEPISEKQFNAAIMWDIYVNTTVTIYSALCIICCKQYYTYALGESGVCENCQNMPRPGMLYPFKIEEK